MGQCHVHPGVDLNGLHHKYREIVNNSIALLKMILNTQDREDRVTALSFWATALSFWATALSF